MVKKRVYEFAKEYDVPSKVVLEKAKEAGFNYTSHVSTMEDGEVTKMNEVMKQTGSKPVSTPQTKQTETKKADVKPKTTTSQSKPASKPAASSRTTTASTPAATTPTTTGATR